MTLDFRQVYVDSGEASPAGLVAAAAGRLVTELSRTEAGSPLTAMMAARELSAAATTALQAAVDQARAAGHSWKEIGDVLQTTRQAAFQRFGQPVDPRAGTPMTRVLLPDAGDRALAIFGEIAAGRWEAARREFGDRMREEVDADRIADAWTQMVALIGRFERAGEPVLRQLGRHTIVDIPLSFEAGEGTGRVTFDHDGTVAGLLVRPALSQP